MSDDKQTLKEPDAAQVAAASEHYSEQSFWNKVKRYAKVAGKEVIGKALQLYYALEEPETPAWARATIYGALGYFILPLDIIPDIAPVVGFTDDLGAIVMALAAVSSCINDEVRRKAADKLAEWFGN